MFQISNYGASEIWNLKFGIKWKEQEQHRGTPNHSST
jgi:hypothetical protein